MKYPTSCRIPRRVWKAFAIIIAIFIIILNISLNQQYSQKCPKCESKGGCDITKLVELAKYYERLLESKGVDVSSIREASRKKNGKIFKVFSKNDIKDTNISVPLRDDVHDLSALKSIKDLHAGVMIDWWDNFCIERLSTEPLWHPLFPKIPGKSTVSLKTGDDERTIGNLFRRIYGFLYTTEESNYDFRLLSRDGAEVVIYDTGLFTDEINKIAHLEYSPTDEVVSLKLTKSLMDYQDERILLTEMFNIEARNINLLKNRVYFLEIIQGGKHFTKYDFQWRENAELDYTTITDKNLFYMKRMSGQNAISPLQQKYKLQPKFGVTDTEKIKLMFNKLPVLDSKKLIETSRKYTCDVPKEYKKATYIYQGYYEFTDNVLLYPNEFFKFGFNSEFVVLDAKEAESVAEKTFSHLSELHN